MKRTLGEKIFHQFNYVLLATVTLLFMVPVLSVIATSLTSASEFAQRGRFILFPYRPVLTGYRMLLGEGSIVLSGFRNSALRVLLGTFLNLAFTFPLAYVMARKSLYGRDAITTFIFITMIFSGGLVPNFILVEKLRLLDTIWALVLPGLINTAWLLIMRNFIMGTIPPELEEAAFVDGATPPQVLFRVILPLSLPIIATIGLWYAVYHWNSWFDALIYINTPQKVPVQPILRNILERGAGSYTEYEEFATEDFLEPPPAETLRAAMIIVTTLPIVFVYPFVQRYFVKGVMVGGVKG